MRCLWLVGVILVPAAQAAVCNPADLHGAYGFLLTGETSIGAAPRPTAVVGRLAFDGSGQVSGVSSAAYSGLVLGNAVTGTYEAHPDCSVLWSLQDDSGAFQHFQGTMSGDGTRVSFRQSDPGGPPSGTLLRAGDDCNLASFQGRYNLTVSGRTVDVDTARDSGAVSVKGFLEADGAGGLSFLADSAAPPLTAGSYEVEDGCFLTLALSLPSQGPALSAMGFRAILTNSGTEVVGFKPIPAPSSASA